MPQFFIKTQNIEDNHIKITDKQDIKHITDVLRLKIGSKISLIDEKEYLHHCEIKDFSKELLIAQILNSEKSTRKLKTDITLFQSIIKSSAQDFAIQKVTELGVKTITPIVSDYTVVKFKNDKDKLKKIERWQKIAYESCKQCERSKMPIVNNILSFNEALNSDFDIKIACVERTAEKTLKEFLRSSPYKEGQKIAIFIGPEGGWSDSEIELFNKRNIPKVSLGNMILRAETAVISAISSVVYEYEN